MEKGVGNESLKTTNAVSDGSDTKTKTGIKTSNIETYGCKVLPSESDSLQNTLKDANDAMMQNESSFPQSSHESEESGNSDNPLADNGNSDDPSTKDAQLLFQLKEGKEVATDESKSITQRMTENEKTYSQSNNQNEASDSQSKVKIMGDSDDSKSSNGHSQPSQVSQISEGSGNHDLSMISDASGNLKEIESVDIKERESSVESDDKFDVTSSNLGSDLPRIRSELGPATTGEGSRGISPKWTLWAPEDLGLNGSHKIDHRRRSDGHAYDCALQPPMSGSADGNTLITDKEKILQRWAEHFESIQYRPSSINDDAISRLPQLPITEVLDDPPTLLDRHRKRYVCYPLAKSPGSDSIPAEICKEGGTTLIERLNQLFYGCASKKLSPEIQRRFHNPPV